MYETRPRDPRFDPRYRRRPMPRRRRRRLRFRWELVWVVLAIMAGLWLLKGVRVAFDFQELTRWMHVRNSERYAKLAVLGIAGICIASIMRALRGKRSDDG